MGVYSSYYYDCPHCKVGRAEFQIKPVTFNEDEIMEALDGKSQQCDCCCNFLTLKKVFKPSIEVLSDD